MEFTLSENYKSWLKEIKSRIRSAQIKAILAVNTELIRFYWELGRMIAKKQDATQWGDKLIETVSKDLMEEFTDIKGLSTRNLKYCRQFYLFYAASQIGQQLVAQIGDSLKVPGNQANLIGQQLVAPNASFICRKGAKLPVKTFCYSP